MDVMKKLEKAVGKGFKPGALLAARNKMSAEYLAKEKKEKPMSKMTPKEKMKEKKEGKVHEKAEHLTKKQVMALKKKMNQKKVAKKSK
jgi:hypothetical protein